MTENRNVTDLHQSERMDERVPLQDTPRGKQTNGKTKQQQLGETVTLVDRENGNQIIIPKENLYIAATGHVQRVIDVALFINNMSHLATVVKRSLYYTEIQFYTLLVTLIISMIAQLIAGISFFIIHQKQMKAKRRVKSIDYTAYLCVAIVMILNIFTSTFGATWGSNEAPVRSWSQQGGYGGITTTTTAAAPNAPPVNGSV